MRFWPRSARHEAALHARNALAGVLGVVLAGCAPMAPSESDITPSGPLPVAPVASATPSEAAEGFPSAAFLALGDEPVSAELAADLQAVLDASAGGHGLTATLITAAGTWSGASGSTATADRAMVPDDQMAIASITKTIVAAQVMQLVEAGQLSLDDLVADRLPPALQFDTNDARIIDLLSMRSGIPQYFTDDEILDSDPLRVWTAEEKLATVPPERGPAGHEWEYIGTNYLLLGLVIEHLTGRSVGEVLRSGVLAGHGYERLIYQPDERPTEPMTVSVESVSSVDAFRNGGGYLPSLSVVTMFTTDGAMASDSISLARWFRNLCAGEVLSPASLDAMTDFAEWPEYGLGVIDRSGEYWPGSGALGHMGGNIAVALCFQDPVAVVVVLANNGHDVDTAAGRLVRAVHAP